MTVRDKEQHRQKFRDREKRKGGGEGRKEGRAGKCYRCPALTLCLPAAPPHPQIPTLQGLVQTPVLGALPPSLKNFN